MPLFSHVVVNPRVFNSASSMYVASASSSPSCFFIDRVHSDFVGVGLLDLSSGDFDGLVILSSGLAADRLASLDGTPWGSFGIPRAV